MDKTTKLSCRRSLRQRKHFVTQRCGINMSQVLSHQQPFVTKFGKTTRDSASAEQRRREVHQLMTQINVMLRFKVGKYEIMEIIDLKSSLEPKVRRA